MNNSAHQQQDPGGPWDVGMERSPLVTFDGDSVTIKNYRNFRYERDEDKKRGQVQFIGPVPVSFARAPTSEVSRQS